MNQNLLMPAMCNNCGELFDLAYDIKKSQIEEIEKELARKKQKRLCWECRINP